jgi:putative SOS response-associated peptidase YedK
MCGRFYIPEPDDDSGFQTILDYVNKTYIDSPILSDMKRGEIFPTNIVPIITDSAPVLMKWGFPRFDGKGQVINARLETAAEKPMFKNAYELHRCLIPAGYYFEWRKDGTAKYKYAIGLDKPIYMAGLYKYEADQQLPLFVILTRPAAPSLSFIHDRMPVIVPEHIRKRWLTERVDSQIILEQSEVNLKYRDAV